MRAVVWLGGILSFLAVALYIAGVTAKAILPLVVVAIVLVGVGVIRERQRDMQTKETPSIYYVLLSRKFWMAVIGLVLILVTAWQQEPFPTDAVVTAIMGVVAAFIGATAWEDASRNQAAGNIAAADITATTTTVSTPGGSDVTVIAPPDSTGTPPPPQPMLDRMG